MARDTLQTIATLLEEAGHPCTLHAEHGVIVVPGTEHLPLVVVRWQEEPAMLLLQTPRLAVADDVAALDLLAATYSLPAGGFAQDPRDGEVVFNLPVPLPASQLSAIVLERCLALVAHALHGRSPLYPEAGETAAAPDDPLAQIAAHLSRHGVSSRAIAEQRLLVLTLPTSEEDSLIVLVRWLPAWHTVQWRVPNVGHMDPTSQDAARDVLAHAYRTAWIAVGVDPRDGEVACIAAQPLGPGEASEEQVDACLAWCVGVLQARGPGGPDYGAAAAALLQALVSGDPVVPVLQRIEAAIGPELVAALEALLRPAAAQPEAVGAIWGEIGNTLVQFSTLRRMAAIETAIACYQAALEVYTREAFPERWAATQNNLGSAYRNRLAGERRENLELAIACYQAALEVYTREAFPTDWAMTQNNLGTAYSDRLAGERRENLELAIACYRAALEVRTREAFPTDWAATQNNLGTAYSDRLAGERRENLETAIACYRAALEVYTREAFPTDWAATQNNLGNAYSDRLAGERRDNLELAIACYRAALEVRTREAFPTDWAATQNNLGSAYRDRLAGERRENLELAIACYRAALQVYTREAFPERWAATQNNLGSAYRNRLAGERRENLELAIACYRAALQVRTREAFPTDWAMTQNNLGTAYSDRLAGERRENLETAIACYRAALEVYTREAFPTDWAATQNNLGTAYSDRLAGERRENLELAIACYRAALEVYTREAFPTDWAATQNNLGTAYSDRLAGERRDNLELAIACYRAALEVRTREAFPTDWAATQNNLGNAYSDRLAGERRENLELAIACYRAALQVYTREAFPTDWAMTQNNLGTAYSDRLAGERRENLETAIACYRAALEVYTREAFPTDWAATQNNLGSAYRNRLAGERRDNLELAIACYRAALEVYTREAFPERWAASQNNLGSAYSNRLAGERRENLELAIACYRAALQVYTREAFPTDWAMTQNNLGTAYSDRLAGERRENLELAIACYRAALQVRTREAFPERWAATQNNLGTAYRNRLAGERRENLETAIACYRAALQVYTREAFPTDWAMTQNNLGTAYSDRLAGERRENLELAIACYRAALQVRTREAFPERWAATQNNLGTAYRNRLAGERRENLETAIACYRAAFGTYSDLAILPEVVRTAYNAGNLHYELEAWEPAAAAYGRALQALEQTRAGAFSDDAKGDLAAQARPIAERRFRCLLHLRRFEEAVATLEQSKTRMLVDLLASRDLQPANAPAELVKEYHRLRAALQALLVQRELQPDPRTSEDRAAQRTAAAGAERERALAAERHTLIQRLEMVSAQLHGYDPDFLPVAPPVRIEDLLRALPTAPRSAAVLLALHADEATAILLHRDSSGAPAALTDADVIPLPGLSEPWLLRRLWESGSGVFWHYWQQDVPAWEEALDTLLGELGQLLVAPLQARLQALAITTVLLVPHHHLHLLPLHACWLAGADGRRTYPLEEFLVGYAPSLAVLGRTHAAPLPRLPRILSVTPQDSGLAFAFDDLAAVGAAGGSVTPLEPVTPEALQQAVTDPRYAVLHASCHGAYTPGDPLQASLVLEGRRALTLADLYGAGTTRVQLHTRLATLSACQAALSSELSAGDEYQGLPAGMLYAGAGAVVAPLWAVDDLATAVLMQRFYAALLAPGADPQGAIAAALRTAQQQVRAMSASEVLEHWLTEGRLGEISDRAVRRHYRVRQARLAAGPSEACPFAATRFWAPFVAIGQVL